MMDYEYFSYEVPRPHVAWVTIERPEVSNAINTPAHVDVINLVIMPTVQRHAMILQRDG